MKSLNNEQLDKVRQKYYDHIKKTLPTKKSQKQSMVGIIGLIASGKSTVAKMIAEKIHGAVFLKIDSVRFLLKEAGLSYDSANDVVIETARKLLEDGYSVVFDSDFVREEKRKSAQELADSLHIPFYLIRITPDEKTAFNRLQKKWEEVEKGIIKQNIDNFLVVTRGKEDNLFRRVPLHKKLRSKDVPQLIGEIGGSDKIDVVEESINKIITAITAH